MKNIVGLVEYTVTGAFLWIVLLVFATWIGVDAGAGKADLSVMNVWSNWLQAIQFPGAGKPLGLGQEALSLVISGILFMGIFSTGLLLDLVAPVAFVPLEIRWVRRWLLLEPPAWFSAVMREHEELIGAEYASLSRPSGWPPVVWRARTYWRLMMFFISYVLGSAKQGQQEEIFDRLKLWRVSRAIALSLLLLALLLTAHTVYLMVYTSANLWEIAVAGIFAPWLLFLVSRTTMYLTFFRLVVSLQAIAYLGRRQERNVTDRLHGAAASGPGTPP